MVFGLVSHSVLVLHGLKSFNEIGLIIFTTFCLPTGIRISFNDWPNRASFLQFGLGSCTHISFFSSLACFVRHRQKRTRNFLIYVLQLGFLK